MAWFEMAGFNRHNDMTLGQHLSAQAASLPTTKEAAAGGGGASQAGGAKGGGKERRDATAATAAALEAAVTSVTPAPGLHVTSRRELVRNGRACNGRA